MKRIKMLLIVIFVLVASSVLPYDFSFAEDPVELRVTVWTGFEGHLNMLNQMAAAYTAQHPNVTAKFDTIPFSDYVQTLTLQLAGSNPPAVGWILETTAPTFIEAGVLVELSDYVKQYDYQDFSKPALKLWERGAKVYGIPFSTSPFGIYYNENLFVKAGLSTPPELIQSGEWTWEKFAEIAKEIKAKTGVYGFQSVDGFGYTSTLWHTLMPIIRAYGGRAWDDEGNCYLNSAEAVKAVQLYHNMIFVDQSVVPPGDESDFFAGNAAMTMGQISRAGKLKDVSWSWDLVPLPKGPAGEAFTIGQAALVAFNTSEHKELAADFVAFMTNKENVKIMSQYFPPARISVMESDKFLNSNPLISPESMKAAVLHGLKKGTVLPAHVNFPKIELTARAEFDNLWVKDADVQQVLDNVVKAIQPLVAKKR